jgi:hypothetical protein
MIAGISRAVVVLAVMQPVQVRQEPDRLNVRVGIELIQDYEEPLPSCFWTRTCRE